MMQGITVATIKIDGCYITDQRRRCDYLFELGEPTHHALYVELKGKDVESIRTIGATLTYFSKDTRAFAASVTSLPHGFPKPQP
jgi:hypothetical protein